MMRLKERIQRELTNPIHQINNELVVTAETSKRMSFSALVKKLDKMNYYVNHKLLGRRFNKQPNRSLIFSKKKLNFNIEDPNLNDNLLDFIIKNTPGWQN